MLGVTACIHVATHCNCALLGSIEAFGNDLEVWSRDLTLPPVPVYYSRNPPIEDVLETQVEDVHLKRCYNTAKHGD